MCVSHPCNPNQKPQHQQIKCIYIYRISICYEIANVIKSTIHINNACLRLTSFVQNQPNVDSTQANNKNETKERMKGRKTTHASTQLNVECNLSNFIRAFFSLQKLLFVHSLFWIPYCSHKSTNHCNKNKRSAYFDCVCHFLDFYETVKSICTFYPI